MNATEICREGVEWRDLARVRLWDFVNEGAIKLGGISLLAEEPKAFQECLCLFKFDTYLRAPWQQQRIRDSSAGVANRYGVDGSGIESRWGGGREIFLTCPDRL